MILISYFRYRELGRFELTSRSISVGLLEGEEEQLADFLGVHYNSCKVKERKAIQCLQQ
jgi:hypothetical protein